MARLRWTRDSTFIDRERSVRFTGEGVYEVPDDAVDEYLDHRSNAWEHVDDQDEDVEADEVPEEDPEPEPEPDADEEPEAEPDPESEPEDDSEPEEEADDAVDEEAADEESAAVDEEAEPETTDEPEPPTDSVDELGVLLDGTVPEVEEAIATGDYDDRLDELAQLEAEGDDRVGVQDAIDARQED